MPSRLDNYLRAYRKRAGLTQKEVAFLLGCADAAQVSRYEQNRRLPTLGTALAYRSILGVPLDKLFPGIQQQIERKIARRTAELRVRLEGKQRSGAAAAMLHRKFLWLDERREVVSSNGQTI
jgi:transcriptional regulator with XRE-family HTH domain